MGRTILAALIVALGVTAAEAAASRISNPDGTVVDVVTTARDSVVTSYDDEGNVTSTLRYPDYAGEEGHERLLRLLSPPGAAIERRE